MNWKDNENNWKDYEENKENELMNWKDNEEIERMNRRTGWIIK